MTRKSERTVRQWGWVFASAALLLAVEGPAQSVFVVDTSAQFTVDEATRGQAAYARACLSCHGAALEGGQFGPALKGELFESHWRGRSRAALSERIRTTMPPGGVGSVSSQGYSDTEAYLIQANGVAPSSSSQPAPRTAQIQSPTAPRTEGQNSVATMMNPVWRAKILMDCTTERSEGGRSEPGHFPRYRLV